MHPLRHRPPLECVLYHRAELQMVRKFRPKKNLREKKSTATWITRAMAVFTTKGGAEYVRAAWKVQRVWFGGEETRLPAAGERTEYEIPKTVHDTQKPHQAGIRALLRSMTLARNIMRMKLMEPRSCRVMNAYIVGVRGSSFVRIGCYRGGNNIRAAHRSHGNGSDINC